MSSVLNNVAEQLKLLERYRAKYGELDDTDGEGGNDEDEEREEDGSDTEHE